MADGALQLHQPTQALLGELVGSLLTVLALVLVTPLAIGLVAAVAMFVVPDSPPTALIAAVLTLPVVLIWVPTARVLRLRLTRRVILRHDHLAFGGLLPRRVPFTAIDAVRVSVPSFFEEAGSFMESAVEVHWGGTRKLFGPSKAGLRFARELHGRCPAAMLEFADDVEEGPATGWTPEALSRRVAYHRRQARRAAAAALAPGLLGAGAAVAASLGDPPPWTGVLIGGLAGLALYGLYSMIVSHRTAGQPPSSEPDPDEPADAGSSPGMPSPSA